MYRMAVPSDSFIIALLALILLTHSASMGDIVSGIFYGVLAVAFLIRAFMLVKRDYL